MLSPIIREPVFEYAEHVLVSSIEAGSEITVSSGQQAIGVSNATSGSAIVKLDRPLQRGETLTAIAKKGGQRSKKSVPVTVQQLLTPLPAPICLATLYAESNCIDTWGMVPGSKVTIVSGNDLLGEATAVTGGALVGLTRPLTTADSVSLFADMGGQQSAKTAGITPIMPMGSGAYAEKLPAPSVQAPLLACQRIAGVQGLLPGGRFWVYADNRTLFDHCSPRPGISALLADELRENQLVTAQQAFEAINLKSDLSDAVRVGPAQNLPAPGILEPVYEGERSLVVLYLLNSVKVEIAVDGNTVGSADYADDAEFVLGYELIAGQEVKARQGLCGFWSPWSQEIVVQARPRRPAPPKVKEPLYACANHVPIRDRLEGALVRVFADGILIGKAKLSLVGVVHLIAGQNITATQTVGKLESQPSSPVIVKGVPEGLPIPKWHGDEVWWAKSKLNVLAMDACASHITVENVLPGAQVNVLWHQLLVGHVEAADTTAIVPLTVKLQPGVQVHLNQSLCAQKSNDSTIATAFGMLAISAQKVTGNSLGPTSSYALVGDKMHVPVVTKCPVWADLKVKLTSTDENVAKAVGSNEIIIAKAKAEGEFIVHAVGPGTAYLSASADDYDFVAETWEIDKAADLWVPVMGTIKIDPVDTTVKVGESFNLSITISPVPADRKVNLAVYGSGTPPFTYPKQITIPSGTNTGTATITGTATGLAWVTVSRQDYTDADNPGGQPPSCRIKVVPATTTPPPTSTTKTYKLMLQWKAPYPTGKMYVLGQLYPIAKGVLKKVRNINTIYPWRYHLWFPGPGATTDDAFDTKKGYLLKSGDEATPSQLNLPTSLSNGLLIGATPSPLDTTQLGPVYVELIYET